MCKIHMVKIRTWQLASRNGAARILAYSYNIDFDYTRQTFGRAELEGGWRYQNQSLRLLCRPSPARESVYIAHHRRTLIHGLRPQIKHTFLLLLSLSPLPFVHSVFVRFFPFPRSCSHRVPDGLVLQTRVNSTLLSLAILLHIYILVVVEIFGYTCVYVCLSTLYFIPSGSVFILYKLWNFILLSHGYSHFFYLLYLRITVLRTFFEFLSFAIFNWKALRIL